MLASMVLNVPQQLVVAITLALSPPGDAPREVSSTVVEAVKTAPRPRPTRKTNPPLAYTEQTWLRIVKEEGQGRGLDDMASRIFRTSSGHYYVPAEKERAALLARRLDASVVTAVARLEAQRNAAIVRNITGRTATPGELYAAHLFGIESALVLIEAAETDPEVPADRLLPDAAARMPHLLTPGGRVLTAGQLARVLSASYERALHGPPVGPTAKPRAPSLQVQPVRATARPGTTGRGGPRVIRITPDSKGVVRLSGGAAQRAQ